MFGNCPAPQKMLIAQFIGVLSFFRPTQAQKWQMKVRTKTFFPHIACKPFVKCSFDHIQTIGHFMRTTNASLNAKPTIILTGRETHISNVFHSRPLSFSSVTIGNICMWWCLLLRSFRQRLHPKWQPVPFIVNYF